MVRSCFTKRGGRAWRKWNESLVQAILVAQVGDGSFPRPSAWSRDGGTVYTTSMAVLSLLVPYRYPPGFASDPRRSREERKIFSALKRATRDDDPRVAAAAERALWQAFREA